MFLLERLPFWSSDLPIFRFPLDGRVPLGTGNKQIWDIRPKYSSQQKGSRHPIIEKDQRFVVLNDGDYKFGSQISSWSFSGIQNGYIGRDYGSLANRTNWSVGKFYPGTLILPHLFLDGYDAVLGSESLVAKDSKLLSSLPSSNDSVVLNQASLGPHFNKLTVKDNECNDCRNEYQYGQNGASDFQNKSEIISALFYGAISLLGFIVFSYFFWQARFNIALNFKWCIARAILGLVVLGYGFYEVLNCIERLS